MTTAVSYEDAYNTIEMGLTMTKSKETREEGLKILYDAPITIAHLKNMGCGSKLCRVFRSLRYGDDARRVQAKWLEAADKELTEHWDELKELFLSKDHIRFVEKAQEKYERTHSYHRSPFPTTPGKNHNDSFTDCDSSFTRDLENLPVKDDLWYKGGVTMPTIPRTPGSRGLDDSFEDYYVGSEAYDSDELSMIPERRPRGRPRKHPLPIPSRGRPSSRRGRRGGRFF